MPPETRERPGGQTGAQVISGEASHDQVTRPRRQWWVPTGPVGGFLADVDTIAEQLIRDAFRDSLASHWHRRAEQIAAGLSRPGDRPGRLTPEQIAERDQRIRNDIARCLRHAQMLEQVEPFREDVSAVVQEVA